ncbi:hypothetical protein [Sporosarcina aquimarina]|uniref:Uncharacterized protein n=2 Tax=Sporosarcina TaxID=1569 RepID=A0ABR8PN86_9BACL|nr:hypothetical protein [Sporosarcina gallistercoris]
MERTEAEWNMQYNQQKMAQLVKKEPELSTRLTQIMKEHELERAFALKALYHAEVKDSGRFMKPYQEL